MKISIKNLRASVSLGIHNWEKASKRIIIINMEIDFDASAVIASGDIKDTIDYTEIEQKLIAFISARHFDLLETLLYESGGYLMQSCSKINQIYMEIEKPGVLRQADSVSISDSFSRF